MVGAGLGANAKCEKQIPFGNDNWKSNSSGNATAKCGDSSAALLA